jgi:hypothetical protein
MPTRPPLTIIFYFTTRVKLHDQWGARLETSVHGVWIRLPGCLLGSQVLMWLMLGTVLGAASFLLFFTWMLSLPTWGLMWTG